MVLYSWFDAILRFEHCRETHWGINQSLTTQRHFLVAEGAGATRGSISEHAVSSLKGVNQPFTHPETALLHSCCSCHPELLERVTGPPNVHAHLSPISLPEESTQP
jgi:hypothetical protein